MPPIPRASALKLASTGRDLGAEVLPGLRVREIEYLRREEFAVSAEDILCRRSKLALHVPADGAARLEEWLRRHAAGEPGTPPLQPL
jgi:glycerol-3-phosphate dehydrogenase